jgi:ribosomal protein S18 acetylase RimI-like enzyme
MVRAYEGAWDREELWACKRAFELGIGAETGPTAKQTAYEDKLDDAYRDDWFDWVDRCVEADPRSVQVAPGDDGSVRGYVFVLPESYRFIWDAAVLNEIYVKPGARGTGIADDLMDAALAYARDMDLPLDRIVLDVDRENPRAKRFYEKWGFDHWGEMVGRDL